MTYKTWITRWTEARDRHLPVIVKDSIWRYSRGSLPGDPEQGWKLHVSATVLTAGRVLNIVAPLLNSHGVLFKAPVSLDEVAKLNAGIYYGFSQVGKFLTIYPQSNAEAVFLAREIYRLTRRMTAPSVPFDRKYQPDGCVYYRYGAFKTMGGQGQTDETKYVIRDPNGAFVPDDRESDANPIWIADPFRSDGRSAARGHAKARVQVTPLQTTFKAFTALGQRGKGGVYQALDLSVAPPRLCLLKEGRRIGEVGWDGRDGFWRIRHESRVLKSLLGFGVNVPSVYASFKADQNYYLALEFIEGENLERHLLRRKRKLTLAAALKKSIEAALLMSSIHTAGWVWRDCKPRNFVLSKDGKLRPIDFEGACPVGKSDPLPWGTPSYVPPEWDAEFRGQSRLPEDLYALGVLIHILFAGRPPEGSPAPPLKKLRRNLPEAVNTVVADLLDVDPQRRPSAESVAGILKLQLDSLPAQRVSQERLLPLATAKNDQQERSRPPLKIPPVSRDVLMR
jgi:hypothetical protein